MKALVLETPGEPPSLAVKEVHTPIPGLHEVLVRVAACGLCHHDIAVMQGLLRRNVKPHMILGHEISGRVVKLGPQVTSINVGDRVISSLTTFCGQCKHCLSGREYRCFRSQGIGHAIDGGFAEFVKLPEATLVAVPQGISLYEASIFACPIGVALQAIRDVALVRAEERVLVAGAGGGLGVHSVQIASALGARVFAVTSSPDKVEFLERISSAEVILADKLDFSEIVLAMTEEIGVDLVVNTVGASLFRSSIDSLSTFGRLMLLGEITGESASINPAELLFRDISILASTGSSQRHIKDVANMVGSGSIKPVVPLTFGFEEATTAYQLMRARKTFGRVLLVP